MENGNGQYVPAEFRPVLYLDIDDTLLTWADGGPRAAPGARAFLLWALQRFTVRWLTTWCPSGEMEASLLGDLCKMLEVEETVFASVRGFNWEATQSKLNGVAWLEHLVLKRPFLWIEDNYGVKKLERGFLAEHGLLAHYRHCNVTEDATSLERLHRTLEREWEQGRFAWDPGALLARAAVPGHA